MTEIAAPACPVCERPFGDPNALHQHQSATGHGSPDWPAGPRRKRRERGGRRTRAALTDEQVVERARELARRFVWARGYLTPGDFRCDLAADPRARECWDFAKVAFDFLTSTSVDDALSAVEDDEP